MSIRQTRRSGCRVTENGNGGAGSAILEQHSAKLHFVSRRSKPGIQQFLDFRYTSGTLARFDVGLDQPDTDRHIRSLQALQPIEGRKGFPVSSGFHQQQGIVLICVEIVRSEAEPFSVH